MRHIFLSLLLLLAAAPLLAQKRYALVVGNGNYAYASLGATPVSDALAMRDALRQAGFEVDYFSNLDYALLSKVTADFGRKIKNSGGVALFYYSGHGVQHQNQNFLVPIGAELADEDDIDGLCVPIERITSRMVGTSINLIILDACRTYPLSRGSKSLTKGLTKEIAPVAELLVAYATTPGSTATVSGEGGLSLYTACLLKHLKTPGLPLASVFQKTRTDVAAKSARQQIPQESGGLTQEFFFFPERRTDPTPPVTEQPIQTEKTPATNPAAQPQSGASPPPNGGGAGGGVDRDYDGTPDATDLCPDDPGSEKAAGCPDADDDGMPDKTDRCKYAAGPKYWQGCPDSDGDGLPDHEDKCPTEKGPSATGGCPPADRDRDGTPDTDDECPDQRGLAEFRGCPDADGDKLPDHKDKCPQKAGEKRFGGCPDTDGDGIPDPDDECPNDKGTAAEKGCPPLARLGYRPDDFVKITGGTFRRDKYDVTVSDFALSRYEVTNAQFALFLNAKDNQTEGGKEWIDLSGSYEQEKCRIRKNGSRYEVESGYEKHPVIYISWYAAAAYCQWLSEQTGQAYRLPTEAEWEYAAGGGSANRTEYAGTNDASVLTQYANFCDSKCGESWADKKQTDGHKYTAPVGSLKKNQLDLYDMSGNVWEWCSDWYAAYPASAQTNPTGPTEGAHRVLRGGSWHLYAVYCRAAYRNYPGPTGRYYNIGFRVALSFQ